MCLLLYREASWPLDHGESGPGKTVGETCLAAGLLRLLTPGSPTPELQAVTCRSICGNEVSLPLDPGRSQCADRCQPSVCPVLTPSKVAGYHSSAPVGVSVAARIRTSERPASSGPEPLPFDRSGTATRRRGIVCRQCRHAATRSRTWEGLTAWTSSTSLWPLGHGGTIPREGFEPSKGYPRVLSPLPLAAWLPRQWVRTDSNSHLPLWRRVSCRWTTHPEATANGGRAIRTPVSSRMPRFQRGPLTRLGQSRHSGETESRTPKPRGSRFQTERSHLSACLTTWEDAVPRSRTESPSLGLT